VTQAVTEAVLPVAAPYRLDLTVAVLRRFSTNVVDVLSPDGEYVRALGGPNGSLVASVRQTAPDTLRVRLRCDPADEASALAMLRRMLGTERRTAVFDAGAREIPWLRDLAVRMLGVRAPRYATLWEACVNAVVFQQVSLHAASAILRRTILALEEPICLGELEVRSFPAAPTVLAAPEATLRAAGLSGAKIATLRRVATVLERGALDEAMLERRTSAAAIDVLCDIPGIGPWTATLILLRGLGRLDVFPANDSGVARSLGTLDAGALDVSVALDLLGAERGMLYFHLLLARLEKSGELGAPRLRADFNAARRLPGATEYR
jgi:DNA-3-methyladenine glycosylase II